MKDNNDKNIYDMLNDIEVDLSEFEKDDFNDIEKMKIKKKIRQSIGKKNTNYKKYISVASIAILSIAMVSITPLGTYASKIISDLVFDLKSALRIEVDDGNYIKVINESITKQGVTLRLNEAVLNDDKLMVSMTTISEEKIPNDVIIEYNGETKLYINEEFIDNVYMINGMNASKNNIDEVLFFNVDTNKYSGEINIKIEIDQLDISRNIKDKYVPEKTIEGPFVFEFDFDTTKINNNTKNIELDKVIKLEDNQEIKLDKFVYNPLSQKIYYTKNKEALDNKTDIVLIGKDDLGNEVRFDPSSEIDGSGQLITNTSGKRVDKSAKYLTLTAYKLIFILESSSYKEELEEIETNITIDLNNNSK